MHILTGKPINYFCGSQHIPLGNLGAFQPHFVYSDEYGSI